MTILGCLLLASTPEVPEADAPPVAVAEEPSTWRPLQLSLFAPIQLVPRRDDVFGLRLGLGKSANRRVFGVDLGVVSLSEQAAGLQVAALWNFTNRDACGLQLAALFNLADTFTGLRVSLFNIASTLRGVEVGVINLGFKLFSHAYAFGLQLGAVNQTSTLAGAQVGLYNEASDGAGVQVGLVNVARRGFLGVQLGLVNIIRGRTVPFVPVVNVSL
ncbi:MAG: hypothetical protein INH41_04505 [Myxococcaceae bacterium]|nr:hypothetical protein [Myxococcaceae bacterium]MCA3011645.1 hypothetical protein [Myxococcaceae bacterium]